MATAVLCAATAKAAAYKMLLCAANNGSNSFQTATNTAYSKYPSGIFSFENYCGPAPDPAGNNAFLRIRDVAADGTAAEAAYGSISWTVPPWVAILAGGGYTREPSSFNQGWRARFWLEGFDGSTNNTLMQGSGVDNGSCGGVCWATTSTFGSHVWPFTSFGNYRRFVFEVTCFRPAGCDRSGENIADANTMTLVLDDVQPPDLYFLASDSALMQGKWVKGSQWVPWYVHDNGSGIREEWVTLDGATRHPLDHAGECDIGASGPSGEFARNWQPCPAGPYWHDWTLDTAALPDGAHTLQVCARDYGQHSGLNGTGGQTCDSRTIHVDNTAPGAPVGLEVTSANPDRYLPDFGARWQLPPDSGSPLASVHYNVVDAQGEVVVPAHTIASSSLTTIPEIEGPAERGDYRLRVWLEDSVGFTGPAATVPVPRDTTPPAAPQEIAVTPPTTSRAAQGFDVRWRNLVDQGSPIDEVHYQVLNAAGAVLVPAQTLEGDNIQEVESLDAPPQRGAATLRIWLEDAEGNVGAPSTAPLAYECVRSEASGGAALSSGLGERGVSEEVVRQGEGSTLRGRLTGSRGGVGEASVCVFSRVVTSPKREFLGVAVTGDDGGYQFAIPAGASRQLSAAYRSGSRELSSQATLQTIVHPTFGVYRKVVHNKHSAQFTGSIPGPENNNVLVVLQVKRGKGWLAFRRYRTREGGKFTVGYKFNKTNVATKYRMRVQVRAQSGYPYLQGNSDKLTLIVVPRATRYKGQPRQVSESRG
ncbi:MAG TPA: hypothetical protein VF245_00460 [Solirubrobacterales bacterium]